MNSEKYYIQAAKELEESGITGIHHWAVNSIPTFKAWNRVYNNNPGHDDKMYINNAKYIILQDYEKHAITA